MLAVQAVALAIAVAACGGGGDGATGPNGGGGGGRPNFKVRTPILTGLAGWDEASFAIQAGSPVAWTIDAWSLATPVVPADGLLLRSATFEGTFVP